MSETFVTLEQRPDLVAQVRGLGLEVWAEFLQHSAVCRRYWRSLYSTFARFQVLLCEPADTVIAAGHTIPVVWDGTKDDLPSGLDGVLERGVGDAERGRTPTTLSALAAMVAPSHQRRGISAAILQAMRATAAANGLTALIAPVRPTLKHRYPLTSIERYVRWTQPDGSPFDPWLRVHWRLGAEFLQVAPQSMVVTGTIQEWETWTGMRFPESGPYVVPGALQPVSIDLESGCGRYEDPNIWMRHATGV
ncbi:MAG: GNAT family N-acetyltransferase [Candidatus Entotheonellia bacterium]